MDSAIFDHSPWLVSDNRYSRVSDLKIVESLLKSARDTHTFLTLCDNNRNLHFKSVLIKINKDSLQIDKPIEWEKESKEFQIFFQDPFDCWNMMRANIVSEGLYTLNVAVPDKIYYLSNRRNSRIKISEDTTASFLSREGSLNDLQVLNLSRSGMLVCGLANDECLPVDSVINDISIYLPEKKSSLTSTRIDMGKIVRTFQLTNSLHTCHAISFIRKNQLDPSRLKNFLPE